LVARAGSCRTRNPSESLRAQVASSLAASPPPAQPRSPGPLSRQR
jgi:hypothetical protein